MILMTLALWGLFLYISTHPPFSTLFYAFENRTIDYRYAVRSHVPEMRNDLAIIALDEKSFETFTDPFLLWAPKIIDLMEALKANGVKQIALDILLAISYEDCFPNHPDLNRRMMDVLSGNKVILISMVSGNKIIWPYGRFATAAGLENVGVAWGEPDIDGIVRKFPIYFSAGPANYPTFPVLVASKEIGEPVNLVGKNLCIGKRTIENEGGRLLINYAGPPMTVKTISFADAMEKVSGKDNRYFLNNFRDKIVFIGVTFPGFKDIFDTPYHVKGCGEMSGTEVVVNAVNTILQGKYIIHPPMRTQAGILLALCIAVALCAFFLRPATGVLAACGILIAFVIFSFLAFDNASLLINIATPCLSTPFVFGGVLVYRYITELREKKLLRDIFGRMASSEVVDEIVEKFEEIMEKGQEKKVTILFSDINNFSTRSENLAPERLLELLNEYFREMVDIVIRNRGVVNKYVGDEIMVIYGAPRSEEKQAYLAVKTAVEMIKKLRDMKKEGGEGFYEIKIGIHTGNVITGFLGSQKRLEYAVIGDNVNIASRVEGLNKSLGATILISEDTYREFEKTGSQVNAQFVNKGPQKVKGRQETVVVYEVIV